MGRGAQWGSEISIAAWAIEITGRTVLMLDLDYGWHWEQAGLKGKRQQLLYTALRCSAGQSVNCGFYGSSVGHCSVAALCGHLRTVECIIQNKIPQGRSVNGKHKRAIIIFILITIIITSIHPLLHLTQWADADLRCSTGPRPREARCLDWHSREGRNVRHLRFIFPVPPTFFFPLPPAVLTRF